MSNQQRNLKNIEAQLIDAVYSDNDEALLELTIAYGIVKRTPPIKEESQTLCQTDTI